MWWWCTEEYIKLDNVCNIRNMQMLKQNDVNANCLYNTYDNSKYIYIIRYCT